MDGRISSVVGHIIPRGGVTHLHYEYDTMIMVEGSEPHIINLKFILLCFDSMLGLKINFDKSEVMVWATRPRSSIELRTTLIVSCRLSQSPT